MISGAFTRLPWRVFFIHAKTYIVDIHHLKTREMGSCCTYKRAPQGAVLLTVTSNFRGFRRRPLFFLDGTDYVISLYGLSCIVIMLLVSVVIVLMRRYFWRIIKKSPYSFAFIHWSCHKWTVTSEYTTQPTCSRILLTLSGVTPSLKTGKDKVTTLPAT